ncbi:hypothetical protein ACFY2W_36305 [Streptomyces sp. NPDC001262]|uniref:hypothetical protein n=1 Tax=Streptomyces sp. NPDC001262 TaxID=3364552 RepID=UPI0036A62C70
MSKRFTRGFTNINTGTVHGGQHVHIHEQDGTTTTVSHQNGRTTKTVVDKDGNETVTLDDGTTHTRYADPQKAFEAFMKAQKNKRR